MKFKHLIDDITIDLWSFWNFASMEYMRRKCNPTVDLSKFISNKNILSKFVAKPYSIIVFIGLTFIWPFCSNGWHIMVLSTEIFKVQISLHPIMNVCDLYIFLNKSGNVKSRYNQTSDVQSRGIKGGGISTQQQFPLH